MEFDDIVTLAAAGLILLQSIYYGIGMFRRDFSYAATGERLGPGMLAAVLLILLQRPDPGHYLIAALAVLWSLLGIAQLERRRIRRELKGDESYRRLQDELGEDFWWRSYFGLFLVRGAVTLIVALPVLAAAANETLPLGAVPLLGGAISLVGILLESLQGWQRGRVALGSLLVWLGLWLIVAPYEYGLAAILSPLSLLFMRFKGSGNPRAASKA